MAGALLGGLSGTVIALIGVAATFRRSTVPVTLSAVLLLIGAAVATLVEAPVTPSALSSGFAQERSVASACATAAGILVLVTAVTLLLRTAPSLSTPGAAVLPETPPGAPVPDEGPAAGAVPRATRLRALAVPAALAVAVGLALLATAPSPPEATRQVADSVALGTGWGRSVEGQIIIDGTEPPVPVILTAVAPGGPRWWTALAGLAAMAGVGSVVVRRGGRRAALIAAGLTGLGLVVVRADLAAAAAAALVVATLALGEPEGRTLPRAALAGVAFGALCLCLPVAVFLLPLLAAGLALHPSTGEVTVSDGLAGVAAALLVFAPWQRWVLERFTTMSPAAELAFPLSVMAAAALPVLVVGLAILAARRRTGPPGAAL